MIKIVDYKIELEPYFDVHDTPETGGVVVFAGTVRNVNQSKSVDYLKYESMVPLAEKVIEQICDDAKQKWNLDKVVVLHRVGRLEIGDVAVLVVTHSMHRKEAYEANVYIMDRVKQEAPIWKKEIYSDGASEWGDNRVVKHSGVDESRLLD